ncbi:MAG: hypothetical protein JNM56_12265 [Planctomycetia bacterium]|nr:hypothetical protein [Planctomycetia bacterium]
MTTLTVRDVPLHHDDPAARLRRTAAAVRVHFTWWGVRRALSNAQKEEIGDAYAAEARLISASKKLIDTRHEAFRKLTGIRTRVQQFWRGLTLPYVEAGIRLLRQSDIELFTHTLQGFQEELTQAEADLNAVYESIKGDARQRLGRLYDAGDYPSEIRHLFALDFDFPSVEPPAYLLRLAPDVYRQEQQRVAARFEEAVRLAEQAFVAELSQLVAHLTERLTAGPEGAKKVFRDSAVGNLTEFFERFRSLNIGSNAQLDALVEQAQQIVRGVEPQALRGQEGLRQQVAAQLGQVQAALDGMLIDAPRRRIVRHSEPRA